ncbi:MAG: RNA polymerase sigma factor [Niabella sp.]
MSHQTPDDDDLLTLFRAEATKEKAFTQIIERYKEKLYWHIRRLVITHEDADDVLQNAFIKAWKGLPNFRSDSKLYTWLYRIATNESLTHLEKQKKIFSGDSDADNEYLSNKVRADEYFDTSKIEWKLQLAIQTLPEQQKIVFILRYFDEMPYKEMSEILQVTEGALKASYHHAVKKIEDHIVNH